MQINLKHYRQHRGMSQKKLAKKVGATQGYISRIEAGIESPTLRMIYMFAGALEICPRLLLPCIIENKENFNCECELNLK